MAMNINYKGRLQEYCVKNGIGRPVYGLISKEGPDHGPFFTCYAKINNIKVEGTAKTRKGAEQDAAKNMYLEVSKVFGLSNQKDDSHKNPVKKDLLENKFLRLKLSPGDHKGINES